MNEIPEEPLDHDKIEELRQQHLEKCQVLFGLALDLVYQFRRMAMAHPDDVELSDLTRTLYATIRCLLNTVTCKVIANGMAADWERLFEHGDEP